MKRRPKVPMERLSAKPTVNIAVERRGRGETVAEYRFLGNDEVDWQRIMAPH